MRRTLMLTGDVNLMNVIDPQVPSARVKETLRPLLAHCRLGLGALYRRAGRGSRRASTSRRR